MSWFLIALGAPFLWAISNYIDKYMLSRFFKPGKFGGIFILSTVIGLLTAPIIYFFKPDVLAVESTNALIMVLIGFAGSFMFFPYFIALQKEDVTTVVPLFQTIPVFVYILSYFILGEQLSGVQIIASLLVIAGAIVLSVEMEGRLRFRNDVFWLMTFASLVSAVDIVLFKMLALKTDYWTVNFWGDIGYAIVAAGIFFLFPSARAEFLSVFTTKRQGVMGANIFNEIIGAGGGLLIAYATLLAPAALVWVTNGFQPFFVFVIGIILTVYFPRLGTESLARRHIVQKLLAITIMFVGVYLLGS